MNVTAKEDFSNITEIARELGAIKFKIDEELTKLSPKLSNFDKQDQIFLHNIEDLMKKDEIVEEDVLKVFREYLDKRPNRRIIKDKQEMLQRLKQGIIKNPSQYVYEFIKNRDNRHYHLKNAQN